MFAKEIVKRIAKRIVNRIAKRGVSAALMFLKRGQHQVVRTCGHPSYAYMHSFQKRVLIRLGSEKVEKSPKRPRTVTSWG